MLNNQGIDCNLEKICFKDGTVFASDYPEKKIEFKDLIRQAYLSRIPLGVYGYYSTPDLSFDREMGKGSPFHYFVFGAALAQVQINLLTGEHQVLKVFIVHETGNSLNKDIDLGQIEGAFIQSAGWCTCEELPRDTTGHYLAITPSTYKIPTIRDLHCDMHIEMIPSGSKYASIFGSKAIGEPPFIYGLTVWFAIQNVVHSVKPDAVLRFPATPEAILLALN
jgi:xanthine dehydrogenase large subunit